MIIQSDAELTKPLSGRIHANGTGNISPPNTLTPNIADTIGLNHGRIGYINHAFSASFDATSSPETSAAIGTPSTWERWQPVLGDSQSITITFTSNQIVNYIGLAGYDLIGATVLVQKSTGGNFTTVEALTGFEAPSRMILLSEFTASKIRLVVTRTVPINLGVVYVGDVLALQRATRGGVTPAPLNQMTSYNTEFSAAGQILGRVINSEGVETKVNLKNLTDDWYRSEFQPFVKVARITPFFYLWNPRDYPDDCIYGVSSKDIAPTLQGGKKFMDVSFNIEGV